MTLRRCALLAAVIATSAAAPAALSADEPTLTIYTYSSFVAEWGPGPALQKEFEGTCGCKIEWVALEDGAALLSRLKLEGDETQEGDPTACFLWLTDQPELNEQTKRKFIANSTVFGKEQLITIDATSCIHSGLVRFSSANHPMQKP